MKHTEFDKIKFDDAAMIWLDEIKKTRKYSTYYKYLSTYRLYLYPKLGRLQLGMIKKEDLLLLQNLLSNILSAHRVSEVTQILKNILLFSNFPEIPDFKTNQCDKIVKNKIYTFNIQEQKLLIEFCLENSDQHKIGIIMALFTGLRLGELCALETKQINLKEKKINITQTVQRINTCSSYSNSKTKLVVSSPKSINSEREIPICDFLYDILKNFMPSEKYFVNNNSVMEPRTYQYKFKKYQQVLSIKEKNFHVLRHTFATNCIAGNMNTKVLSEILGHSNVQTTLNLYCHPSFDTKLNQLNGSIKNIITY